MASLPELWAFVLSNVGLFIVSSLLTSLSYLAYRQSDGHRSYAIAATGFGFVVLGGLVEPVYQLGVGVDYTLTGAQLMRLQTVETVLIAAGLGLLFYAIVRHRPATASSEGGHAAFDDADWSGTAQYRFGD